MTFDFDEIINFRGTNSLKWDELGLRYGVTDPDAIPMWVAEMDFRSPPAVQATLDNIRKHGVYGYFGDDRAYRASIANWMKTRHDWQVDPGHILTTHGLVQAVSLAIQAFSRPHEGVIVFTPVYHAFMRAITNNKRKVVESQLVVKDGVHHMDLDALANALTGKERILILCSPHNPGGRIWTVEEQKAVAQFCIDHDLVLIADEIHHDLVYPGESHTVMANAAPEVADRLITMTAASKAFNLAGEHTAQTTMTNAKMRRKFQEKMAANSIGYNRIGAMLTTAAYAHGADWIDALMVYLDGNRRLFFDEINDIKGLSTTLPQATYLTWVDFTATGMTMDEIVTRCQRDARVVANLGPTFGTGGEGFMRFNIATRRSLLREALERIRKAFSDLQ